MFAVLRAVLTAEKKGSLDDLIKAAVYARYEATNARKRREFNELLIGEGDDEDDGW